MTGQWDRRGKGYGAETTHLMLGYGFTHLNLHNIMLSAFSTNLRALRAHARIRLPRVRAAVRVPMGHLP